MDMAGFAVSVEFLRQRPKASMPFKPGFEEDGFLKSLAPFEPKDVELLAANCTKVRDVGVCGLEMRVVFVADIGLAHSN